MRALFALCWILLFCPFSAIAQFNGGNGDGSHVALTSTFLNGTSTNTIFSGGLADGFSKSSFSAFLSGAALSQLYNGGTADGFSRFGNSSFLNGTMLSSLYNGGKGDGFDRDVKSSFLDGTLLALLYNGGNNDGYDQSGNASFLDGSFLSLYTGGKADGFDNTHNSSFLDGTSLALLYGGSNGDGFAANSTSQFLDGNNLSLYYGGDGDGYAKSSGLVISNTLAYALWTGSTSVDWQTPSNWYRDFTPTPSRDVIIDGLPVNQPSIGTDVIIQSLKVNTGATVEIQPGFSLSVLGNLNIIGNEGLILRSGASSDGYSQLLVKGQVQGTGTVKSEFYVGGNAGFRHLASPVFTTFDDLKVGANLLVAANSPNGNLYYWEANTALWSAPNSTSEFFDNGIGYAVYMGTNQFGTYVSTLPSTLDLSGQLQSSVNVVVNLGYNSGQNSHFFTPGAPQAQTEGWNLIGNPYPCTYDWDGQLFPQEMVNHGIAVWDATSGHYAYYNNGTSLNGGSRYIAPYQGFFVQTTAAALFTFLEDNRVVNQNPSLLKTEPTDVKLAFTDEVTNEKDELIVGFSNEAFDAFDGQFDMWKLINDDYATSCYSIIEGGTYAINRMADFEMHKSIRIGFQNAKSGTYAVSADLAQINPDFSVELEDLEIRKFYNLRLGDYRFNHNPQNDHNRFILHINKNGELIGAHPGSPGDLVLIKGTQNGVQIDFSKAMAGAKRIVVYDLVGRKISESNVAPEIALVDVFFDTGQTTYVIVHVVGDGWVLNDKVFIDQ